jgi:arylformamidase
MIIDLSAVVNADTPVYPGDPPVKVEAAGIYATDGYTDHMLSLGTHTGTHIDAPAHMIENGKTLDKFPPEHFVGPGKLVEGFDLAKVKQAEVGEGDIVLFHTGLSAKFYDEEYWEIREAMSEEIAKYLVDAKVKMVGMDTGGADTKGSDGHPIHKILLGSDVLIIENLVNLEKLAGKKFKVYALPINLNVDGAPARVIVETE